MWFHIALGFVWGLGIAAWLWYPGYVAHHRWLALCDQELVEDHYEL